MVTKLEEIGRQVFFGAERDLTTQDCFDLVREVDNWKFGTDKILLGEAPLDGTRVQLKLTEGYLNIEVFKDRNRKGNPYSLYNETITGGFGRLYEETNDVLAAW